MDETESLASLDWTAFPAAVEHPDSMAFLEWMGCQDREDKTEQTECLVQRDHKANQDRLALKVFESTRLTMNTINRKQILQD